MQFAEHFRRGAAEQRAGNRDDRTRSTRRSDSTSQRRVHRHDNSERRHALECSRSASKRKPSDKSPPEPRRRINADEIIRMAGFRLFKGLSNSEPQLKRRRLGLDSSPTKPAVAPPVASDAAAGVSPSLPTTPPIAECSTPQPSFSLADIPLPPEPFIPQSTTAGALECRSDSSVVSPPPITAICQPSDLKSFIDNQIDRWIQRIST